MRKKRPDPIPTPEDREAVERRSETFYERITELAVLDEARRRVAREEAERRRQRLNRLSLGLLGRH